MSFSLLDSGIATAELTKFVNFSMGKFMPELILTAGFLFAIILDLLLKQKNAKKLVGYFAFIVIAAAFVMSWEQLSFFHGEMKDIPKWAGGKMIFPYSNTLPAPQLISPAEGYFAQFSMVVVDNLAVIFKMIISLAAMFVVGMSLLSREVEERGRRNGEFFALLIAMTLGMFLMPSSMDLLMMYISLELVSITSYIMSGFMKDNARSTEASMKYVLFGAFSSGLMIYGFSILYGMTGSTNILVIKGVLETQFVSGSVNNVALWTAFLLSMVGMGYKISAVPFHFWTPDVYEGAPIPVTALLSVASKAGGFGLLMRFLFFAIPANHTTMQPYLNWPIVVAVMAALTMTLGNFAALRQSNVKRMLAYSTIAHAGYMMVALVSVGAFQALIGLDPTSPTNAGITAILIYFISYLFTNLGAFYVIMLIANKINSEEIEDYKGFAKRSPLLAVCLSLFLVSLTGIPLTVGFIGKFYIFLSILKQPQWLWLTVVMALNSVVSLYYYVRVMQSMFIKQADAQTATGMSLVEVGADGTLNYSLISKIFIFVFLIPTIILGVYFTPLVDFAGNAIRFF